METDQISNHLKYINCNGVTFNIEERLNLDLALQKLQNDFVFEELLLWGKINGIAKDYYLAVAIKYKGELDFPKKTFFWCNSANWTFALLPEPHHYLRHTFDKLQIYFSGEFDQIIFDASGKATQPDIQVEEGLPFPDRGITELDRLGYVVNAIEQDCQTVPLGSLKMTPIKEVRRNEAFKGLKKDNAFTLEAYQHFRKVIHREKRDKLDRDESVFNHDFLDEISQDLPKDTWSVLKDTTEQVAVLRSQLWPGYYAYHRLYTPIYGSIYIGDGIKTLDLPYQV